MRNDGSNNGDRVWFDQVVITDTSGLAPVSNNKTRLTEFNLVSNNNIKLYPNPTNSLLNIKILEGSFDEIIVFSSTGKLVYRADRGVDNLTIDVSQFATGTYFIRFVSEGMAVTKRFVKN